MIIKNKQKLFIFLTALLGLLISIELSYIYFKVNFLGNYNPSFCTINEVIDCDSMAQSIYSTFLGVPYSIWGMGYYIFVIGLMTFPFNKFAVFKHFKNPISYINVLSIFGMSVSVGLWFVSSFVIHKVCLLCYFLYFVNAALLIITKKGNSFSFHIEKTFEDIKNIFSQKIWVAAFIAAIILGSTTLVAINIFHVFVPEVNKTKIEVNIPKIGNILGDADAKLVIMEFTDYECPFCALSNKMLIKLAQEVDGIRIEHYDFPLNESCNPDVGKTVHQNSCRAIYYARAARRQGKFWDLSALMFEYQEDLSEKNILKLAESIGLDIEQLKKDARDPALREEIKFDLEKAKRFKIVGTPTHIIGIKKYEGVDPYNELKQKVLDSL